MFSTFCNFPFLFIQRHRVRIVPVTEAVYKWKTKDYNYFVYGFENKVHAPTYPQRCCWGCNILWITQTAGERYTPCSDTNRRMGWYVPALSVTHHRNHWNEILDLHADEFVVQFSPSDERLSKLRIKCKLNHFVTLARAHPSYVTSFVCH